MKLREGKPYRVTVSFFLVPEVDDGRWTNADMLEIAQRLNEGKQVGHACGLDVQALDLDQLDTAAKDLAARVAHLEQHRVERADLAALDAKTMERRRRLEERITRLEHEIGIGGGV